MLYNNAAEILNSEMTTVGTVIQRGRKKGDSDIEPFLAESTVFKRIFEMCILHRSRAIINILGLAPNLSVPLLKRILNMEVSNLQRANFKS